MSLSPWSSEHDDSHDGRGDVGETHVWTLDDVVRPCHMSFAHLEARPCVDSLVLGGDVLATLEGGLLALRGHIHAEISQLVALVHPALCMAEAASHVMSPEEKCRRFAAAAECPPPPPSSRVDGQGAPQMGCPRPPRGSPSGLLDSISEDVDASDGQVPPPPARTSSVCESVYADLDLEDEFASHDIEGSVASPWNRGLTPCFGDGLIPSECGGTRPPDLRSSWLLPDSLAAPAEDKSGMVAAIDGAGIARRPPESTSIGPLPELLSSKERSAHSEDNMPATVTERSGGLIAAADGAPIARRHSPQNVDAKDFIPHARSREYVMQHSRVSFPMSDTTSASAELHRVTAGTGLASVATVAAVVEEVEDDTEAIINEEERLAREFAIKSACQEELKALQRTTTMTVGFWQKLVESANFELFIGLLILTNSALIGIEVQWQVDHLGQDTPIALYIAQHAYCVLFTLELLLRFRAYGCGHFFTLSLGWVHLDTFIVSAALFEMVIDILVLTGAAGTFLSIDGVSQLRIVRIIRVTRIVRTFRIQRIIRFVSPLRTLVFSIAVTLKSLMWAMVLLMLIIYVVSIIMTQTAAQWIADGVPQHVEVGLRDYWFSLDRAMITCFQSISGGVSWRDAAVPMEAISVPIAFIFTLYIGFVYFAVLNVVTGVFCSCAIETTQRNPEVIATSMIKNKQTYIENLKQFFRNMDKDNSGMITLTEFESMLQDEMMRAHLLALEIDASDAWTLFKLIDNDKSGVIEIDEFVTGCEQLKGGAKGVDVANIQAELKSLTKRLVKFMRYTEDQLETVTGVPGVTKAKSNATRCSKDGEAQDILSPRSGF